MAKGRRKRPVQLPPAKRWDQQRTDTHSTRRIEILEKKGNGRGFWMTPFGWRYRENPEKQITTSSLGQKHIHILCTVVFRPERPERIRALKNFGSEPLRSSCPTSEWRLRNGCIWFMNINHGSFLMIFFFFFTYRWGVVTDLSWWLTSFLGSMSTKKCWNQSRRKFWPAEPKHFWKRMDIVLFGMEFVGDRTTTKSASSSPHLIRFYTTNKATRFVIQRINTNI